MRTRVRIMEAADVELLIIVAVAEELRAVLHRTHRAVRRRDGGQEYWLGALGDKSVAVVRTGMGRDRARAAVGAVLTTVRPRAAVVMGFCGGISEWADAASLVLAEYVMDWPDFPGKSDTDQPDQVFRPDPSLMEAARAIQVPGARIVEGGILSVGRLVRTTQVKGYHGPRAARCRAIDMESGVVVWLLEEAGVPWVTLRSVSDTLDEDLPLPFEEFLRPDGEIDRRRVLAAALVEPGLMLPLFRLGRQSLKAAANMARFAEQLARAM